MEVESAKPIDSISGDRRAARRYDLQLEVRWTLIRRRRAVDSGVGRTIDISSRGVLFEADRPLPLAWNVELSVFWPVLLGDVAPLQLAISGAIVRSQGQRVAIRMHRHEFRIRAHSLPGTGGVAETRIA